MSDSIKHNKFWHEDSFIWCHRRKRIAKFSSKIERKVKKKKRCGIIYYDTYSGYEQKEAC